MRKTPPLLPAETLRRVVRVARTNGTSVLFSAGMFALFTASGHDELGTAVCLLAAGSGAIELHGAGLLCQAEDRGVRWLVASQAFLLLVILGYVSYRMNHMDLTVISAMIPEPYLREVSAQSGIPADQVKQEFYALGNFLLAGATLIYQGWMMIYYSRRRQAVTTALAQAQE